MKFPCGLVLLTAPILFAGWLQAQSPKEIVSQAVQTELSASHNDHSHWRYRQYEKLPVETVSIVVQTPKGTVREKIEQDGHPFTPEQTSAEAKRLQSFVHDEELQRKQKRDAEHDDRSAEKLMAMLPNAFTWRVVGETPELITLAFQPDTSFNPPDMEARVMSAMTGEMIVDRAQHRIRTFRGALSQDVLIGYGLLGKLRQGGTFDVERRQLTPGVWQITETHVHIDGRALLFKTIGEQQDEINTDYTRMPDTLTLTEAASMLLDHKETGLSSSSTR